MNISKSVSARDLLLAGECSAPCLLATIDSPHDCDCRCQGEFHGLLADEPIHIGQTRWRCFFCERIIEHNRAHLASLRKQVTVWCSDCAIGKNSRTVHATLWPECPHRWHDAFDHPHLYCADRMTLRNLLQRRPGLQP